MKQSKGYRVLAMIHTWICMITFSSGLACMMLGIRNWAMGCLVVGITAMFSAMIYDVMADKVARREWRTIRK